MTSAERKIERLLAQAHDLAWDAGRFDLTVQIIKSINLCRGYIARPVSDMRHDDQRDCDEYAAECGVTVSELLSNK
jgi:hypothetical protein